MAAACKTTNTMWSWKFYSTHATAVSLSLCYLIVKVEAVCVLIVKLAPFVDDAYDLRVRPANCDQCLLAAILPTACKLLPVG